MSYKPKAKRLAAALLPVVAALAAVMPSAAIAATGSIMVTNQNDSGPGSLREAIADAAPADGVIVPAGMYLLSSGGLAVDKSLTISGAGASTTIIDAQTASRVIHTTGAGNQITISGVTIRNGKAGPPPGVARVQGGGILNDQASLTLSDDVITHNQANADGRAMGGGGGAAIGGGVSSTGSLTLVDTDVKANTASAVGNNGEGGGTASAGGVFSNGALSVRGSTFEGNLADARGGPTPLNPNQRGAIPPNDGVGIENTVISTGAADAGSENCGADGTLSSLGSNIDSRDQCEFHARGDLVSKDPLLGDLQDNGGPVETAALTTGSPAIDAGAAGACPGTDARGVLRRQRATGRPFIRYHLSLPDHRPQRDRNRYRRRQDVHHHIAGNHADSAAHRVRGSPLLSALSVGVAVSL